MSSSSNVIILGALSLSLSLLLSARKEPGKYVEGVVLADNLEALFRSVPPPLSLALAMTEKHEKAERAEIMRKLTLH